MTTTFEMPGGKAKVTVSVLTGRSHPVELESGDDGNEKQELVII